MPQIIEYHNKNKFPDHPNLIRGDWNGDGRRDYAALIHYGREKSNSGESLLSYFVVAFIKRTRGYSYYKLEGGDYIQKMKKGERGYDYNRDRNFIYKNDAIFSGIWEKAGESYVWQNGKFRSITISD